MKPLKTHKKKVFVGMSGGVDSSVSAALLKKAGYDVTGVFIKVWQPDWMSCTWREDRIDAMRVAAHLDIPFITLDLEKEYKKEVVDYMIDEYRAGRTPNPDVMCNSHVKFGAFYDWAMKQGADYVATGHYARIQDVSLLAGKDQNKDQSYFLYTLKEEQLKHVLFPVGDIEKPEVRKLAKRFKLPTALKKDSQGLCFIGKVDIQEFLSHYIQTKEGNVLDEKDVIIGTHPGALFFTIGERHGFTIAKKTPDDKPCYVTAKDIEKNTITVSAKDSNEILPGAVKQVDISNLNWISGAPEVGKKLQARSRYRQQLQDIKISGLNGDSATIEFHKLQDTLTPGQSLVIYDGEKCLGGGIIC